VKAELNVASNNLSGNLSPKVDIKDVAIKDNKLLNFGDIYNLPLSTCKEDETTCYDTSKKDNIAIYCKQGDADC